MIYPSKINSVLDCLSYAKTGLSGNAVGSEANFACGSYIRFCLQIDPERAVVADAAFISNGCGWMLAAAQTLAESVAGENLRDLHGLVSDEIGAMLIERLGDVPPERRDCVSAASAAFRSAFADHRSRSLEEFRGEKALICTCFGVTEEMIEKRIQSSNLTTVDQVAADCNAGSGCGSCRMLIQAMLDAHGISI